MWKRRSRRIEKGRSSFKKFVEKLKDEKDLIPTESNESKKVRSG